MLLAGLSNSSCPNIDDIAGGSDPTIVFSNQRHGFVVSLRPVSGGTAVFHKRDVVVEHEADGERVEHAHARSDTGNEQTFYLTGAEQHIQIRADERAVAMLGDDHLSGQRFQPLVKLGTPAALRAGEQLRMLKFCPDR